MRSNSFKNNNAFLATITISVAGAVAGALIGFGNTSAINALAKNSTSGLGVPSVEKLDLSEYYDHFSNQSELPDNNNTLIVPSVASACDLSLQNNFPAIEDQGGLGACTSMATAYYQYTFEAYKGTNIDLKDADNRELIYSPSWTFNFTNGDTNGGAFIYEAYDVLKNQGCLKIGEYPFDISNFSYDWSTDTEAMINALNLRILDDGVIRVSGNNASNNLDTIKSTLYGTDGTDGHVLTFSTEVYGWQYKDGTNLDTNATESVAYRCYNGGGGHSMTIVGYNDNIWCDINGNGVQDSGELGAFKIANSWGTTYRNNGYVWVAYDALNTTSKVSGDWESTYTTKRKPIFQYEFADENTLYWMEVGEKTVYYVGQLTIDTDYRNSLDAFVGRSDKSDTTTDELEHRLIAQGISTNVVSHTGTLVFDYDDLCLPIGNYISGYNWYIDLEGKHNSASFKITDNLSNVIVDLGSISTGESYMPISLSMGDLNYDGVVDDNDTTIFNNARHGNGKLSNLQEYLATNMSVQEEDYTISYGTGDTWGNGETGDIYQNIEITITNNGDTPIRNWAIRCNDFCGTPTENIWNGVFYGDNIIKNAGYNSDIASGQSVTIGYIVKNPTGETPVFSLCTFRTARTDGYDVEFIEDVSWGSEFIGTITITNTTNEPIMAWELTFDAVNFEIASTGQFEILTHSGDTYTITGTYNGNIPIPANTSITMQFNGTKTGTTSISNISMTEMKF